MTGNESRSFMQNSAIIRHFFPPEVFPVSPRYWTPVPVIRSIILMDFFHRLTTKFKILKLQRFENWLCLRHQVKNGGTSSVSLLIFIRNKSSTPNRLYSNRAQKIALQSSVYKVGDGEKFHDWSVYNHVISIILSKCSRIATNNSR